MPTNHSNVLEFRFKVTLNISPPVTQRRNHFCWLSVLFQRHSQSFFLFLDSFACVPVGRRWTRKEAKKKKRSSFLIVDWLATEAHRRSTATPGRPPIKFSKQNYQESHSVKLSPVLWNYGPQFQIKLGKFTFKWDKQIRNNKNRRKTEEGSTNAR